ncbi:MULTISPECIES: hypothetical protein [unclassified Xanthomonas]|uniref:hypothetical protein n=1 Tax=unclassified Xanthomonas TaxID=2643310 RepID=UPI00288306DB|nr:MULTISPECIES: hypothetical protein [unclassified Xanthomonas]
MKRIGVLLLVLVALAFAMTRIGAQVVPRSESAAAKTKAKHSMTAAENKAQQEKWFGAETTVAAERAVRSELKDPDAAQFRDVRANYTEKFGVVACGRVNARNELGGYAGFRRFVSGGKSVILEGRDNIADAWAGACN